MSKKTFNHANFSHIESKKIRAFLVRVGEVTSEEDTNLFICIKTFAINLI